MKYKFKTNIHKTLSDIHTPVELYLKIRDKFPGSFLLESSDYKSKENSYSYICLKPIASFISGKEQTKISYPKKKQEVFETQKADITQKLYEFCNHFESEKINTGFITNGLFGYVSYDAIPMFEEIKFKPSSFDFPLIHYQVFKYLIVFNHFNNELFIIENLLATEESELNHIRDIITNRAVTTFHFYTNGEETSNFSDKNFLAAIEKGIKHVHLGDVIQVVLSRKFSKQFKGDEFNVYRALRSINPSPYLFYFDYGNFKLFGSSPEAQLTIANNQVSIHPIAGTFKRTGNIKEDEKLAVELSNDPKENAEHVMLVDLARNDLSKFSKKVELEKFREVEYYSHVIHLVSKVNAELEGSYNPIQLLGGTHPAGTLSGAPKHRAMEIIDKTEPDSRGIYGGALGYIGFNGEVNHAIFIRSFLSNKNKLTFQAGCGIVASSNPEKELQEVSNKLSALRNAIELAKTI